MVRAREGVSPVAKNRENSVTIEANAAGTGAAAFARPVSVPANVRAAGRPACRAAERKPIRE
jgi:hypothetical protein